MRFRLLLRSRALGKYLELQLRLLEKYHHRARERTYVLWAYSRFVNYTYFANRRSCFCRRPDPWRSFSAARADRSRWFSGRIASRRRNSKTWDYRDSSPPRRGDTPCRGRYRVWEIRWTRDRVLSARSPVCPETAKNYMMWFSPYKIFNFI